MWGAMMQFRQPYYVSPHAVQRFRERVADLPTKTIRTIIQATLQDPKQEVIINGYNKGAPARFVYHARFQNVEYLIIVQREMRKRKAWPVVKTVLLPGMEIENYGTIQGVRW